MKETSKWCVWLLQAVAIVAVGAAERSRADAVGSTISDTSGHKMAYRLYRPPNYTDPTAKIPLVIFLHGVGERGTDAQNTSSTTISSHIGGLISATQGSTYSSYLLTPQVPPPNTAGYSAGDSSPQFVNIPFSTGSYTNSNAPAESTWMALTLQLLDQTIATTPNVDTHRIYLTGLSMGGYGAWDMLARRPNLFAAAVPMSGGGNTDTAPSIKNVPIWDFHGDMDTTVPVSGSRDMINALRAAGGDPKYNEIVNGGHAIWDPLYNDDPSSATGGQLYPWMFAQSTPEPTGIAILALSGLLLRRRRAIA